MPVALWRELRAGRLGLHRGLAAANLRLPNRRVQRTRSSASPLRSPLTRYPLGGRWDRRCFVACHLLTALAITGLEAQEAAPSPVAAQALEIRATYVSPQISGDDSRDPFWNVVLSDRGDSYLETGGEKIVLAVPKERLAALRAAVTSEKFFKLKDEYGYFPTDGPERQMEVRLGSKRKKVVVGSIEPQMTSRKSQEVDRAMRVWFAIMDCFKLPKRPAA